MAITGLSNPTIAKYTNTAGTVAYSDGARVGHAINYSLSVEYADDNPLYGDNRIVENESGTFNKGTLSLETSELPAAINKLLLNLTETTKTYGSGDDAFTVTEYAYDDNAKLGLFGIGFIRQEVIDDVTYYVGIVLPKCRAKFNDESATTRGESIDWQTPTIEFDVERTDAATGNGAWKFQTGLCDSEANAQTWINDLLNIS